MCKAIVSILSNTRYISVYCFIYIIFKMLIFVITSKSLELYFNIINILNISSNISVIYDSLILNNYIYCVYNLIIMFIHSNILYINAMDSSPITLILSNK